MKKITFILFSLLCVGFAASAQDDATPLYTAVGETVTYADGYGESYFPAVENVGVEVYADYILLKSWSGVEGRDMKVYYDEDENMTKLIPVRNGNDQDPVETAAYIYTGLEDPSAIYAYVSGYSYASSDETSEYGYVYISAYINNKLGYYWCSWGEEDNDPDAIYTALGEVTPTEGWGSTPMPELKGIKVAGYDGYVIIRGFAGVSGYDLKVDLGENDAVTGLTPIVDYEEGETVTSGYAKVQTGLDDYPEIDMYVAPKSCYAASDTIEESGYFIISAKFGETDGYYYIYWPQSDEESGEWTNPFEGDATFLYAGIGETGTWEDWGATTFPVIKDIVVEVYDKYIYIHNLAGVEGYGAKVAYNEDEEVPSIIAVENGKDSEPCKEYIYLYTGLVSNPIIQAYTGYSNAGLDDTDNTGYVILGAYIYDADGNYNWNYYYLTWTKDESNGISAVSVDKAEKQMYNVLGQPVDKEYKGFIIVDGKKYLNR